MSTPSTLRRHAIIALTLAGTTLALGTALAINRDEPEPLEWAEPLGAPVSLGMMAVGDANNYDHDAAIIIERTVNLEPSEVWRLLTTEQGLADWLVGRDAEGNPNARVELRVGGPYELFFAPNAPEGQRGGEGCVITSFIPNRMISFTWNAPPNYPTERQQRTWVVIELEQIPSEREWEADPRTGLFKTRVRLTHLGWPADAMAAEHPPLDNGMPGGWPGVRVYFVRAWNAVIGLLQQQGVAE